MKKLIVLAAFILALSASMANANLLTNGSFEDLLGTYDDSGPGYETLNAGSGDIQGRTVDVGSIDWIGSYWKAADGSMSLDMNGLEAAGTISQTFAVAANMTYRVTFAMSGNPDNLPAIKTMVTGVDISIPHTFVYDISTIPTSRTNMGWTDMFYEFTTGAIAGNATIKFQSATTGGNPHPDSYGPALDNVRIEAVPEASTLVGFGSALAMAGPGMIGWLRRRRS